MYKRVTRVKKNKRLKTFIAVSIFAMCVLITALSPVFNLRQVEVVGATKYSEDRIRDVSGLDIGENIFKLSRKNAKEKILKSLPYIESVKISWRFLNIFLINIVERYAVAQVEHMGSYMLMDKKGYILQIENKAQDGFAIIKGMEFARLDTTQRINDENNIRFATAILLIEKLTVNDLLNKLQLVDVSDIDNIHIKIMSGILINLRNTDNLEYKVKYINKILASLNENEKGYIDFTTSTSPIFKPQE